MLWAIIIIIISANFSTLCLHQVLNGRSTFVGIQTGNLLVTTQLLDVIMNENFTKMNHKCLLEFIECGYESKNKIYILV